MRKIDTDNRLREQQSSFSRASGTEDLAPQRIRHRVRHFCEQLQEQKAELALASEAALEADVRNTKLAADHKRLLAKTDALQAEASCLSPSRCKHQFRDSEWFCMMTI